jgi:hypothetical protein
VALSRHRRSVDLHYGRDDFADWERMSFANSGDHGSAKRIADSMGAMAQGHSG